MSTIINNVFDYMQNTSYPGGIMHKMKDYLNGQRLSGNSNKMLFQWLRKNGYTGNLNEMIAKFGKDNPTLLDGFLQDPFTISPSVSTDWTFSRTSGQTGVDSSNLLYEAATGVPAYIAGKGILLEGARTNLLTYSRDMTNAAWTKVDTTVTRNQTGADGAANSACLITEGSVGTAATFQNATVAAGSTITSSIVVKRGNNDWIQLFAWSGTNGGRTWFNLANGTKGQTVVIGTGTNFSGSITSIGSGWYRCSVTATIDAADTTGSIEIRSAAGDGSARVSGATYIVDYAQLEVAPFASSPIETVAAAVTRNATSLSRSWTLPANNFSGQIKFRPQFARGQLINQSLISFSDGTANNRFYVQTSATGYLQFVKYIGGTSSFGTAAITFEFISNQLINIRFKQDSAGYSFWVNSGSKLTTISGIAPDNFSTVLTTLWINQAISGSSPGFLSIESLKLWHEAKSDEFLAALT